MIELITPAKASEGGAEPGVDLTIALRHWIPAFADMTATFCVIGPAQ